MGILISGSLLLCLPACAPYGGVGTRPDEVLFARGLEAEKRNRCDIARVTFATLTNTYPESPYSNKARREVQDLNMSYDGWGTSPESLGHTCP